MTIASQDELQVTQQRINDLELALATARRRLGNQPKSLASVLSSHQRQLAELRFEVNEFLGMTGLKEAAYEIRFGTSEEAQGAAPISAFEKVVGNFRDAMTAIAEKLSTGKDRKSGRPPAELARQVDFRVVGIAPGSVRLLLEPPLQRGLPGQDLPSEAFSILEETAKWVEAGGDAPESLKDVSLRKLALRHVHRLSPSEWTQVTWIELSGPTKRTTPSARLTSTSYRRAESLLGQPTEETLEMTGRLRAIDLDKAMFEIRPARGGGPRQRCKVPTELLPDALDHIAGQTTVVVRGTKKAGILNVLSLRPADQ